MNRDRLVHPLIGCLGFIGVGSLAATLAYYTLRVDESLHREILRRHSSEQQCPTESLECRYENLPPTERWFHDRAACMKGIEWYMQNRASDSNTVLSESYCNDLFPLTSYTPLQEKK